MNDADHDPLRREADQALGNDRKRTPPTSDQPVEEPPPPGPHVEPDVAETPGPGIRPPL